MKNYLPQAFEERMQQMLKDEYEIYRKSYDEPRQYALRVNTLKISPEKFSERAGFPVEPIPWISNGFFCGNEVRPAQLPWYAAGVYYLQEPSAMTPASRLEVSPGDRVLDLCAAPGGKATELGAKLKGEGLLVANDISASRAKALLYNLELSGIANAFVTNEIPGRLAEKFPEYFDKILVDAPCSGEGMFRKDPAVAKAWDAQRPAYFAKMQREIVLQAEKMLKPGGLMLYSTCTFSPEENEGTVSFLLENCPGMQLIEMEGYEGFSPGTPDWGNAGECLKKCVRIWPHKMNGEGHFLALLKKEGTKPAVPDKPVRKAPDKNTLRILEAFFQNVKKTMDWDRVEVRAGKVYLVPDLPDTVRGLRFLRNGLYLGELKKDRFEPSQAFAMSLKANEYTSVLRMKAEDERIERYLRGETIFVEKGECALEKGWQLVCLEEFPLGWGKLVNGVLKNKYLCSWRKN